MMRKFLILAIVFCCTALILPPTSARADSSSSNLDQYVQYFYDRYSKNFDSDGLRYVNPWYGVLKPKEPETPREWMSLSSFYRYRAQRGESAAVSRIRDGILNSLAEWRIHSSLAFSFDDAIAAFLAVRMVESVPGVVSAAETDDLLSYISSRLYGAVLTPETENRAIIAGAHWQYLANYLSAGGYLSGDAKAAVDVQIKKKIDTAVAACINSSYWYLEGKKRFLSPHYHTVSAFMLMFYADQSAQQSYGTVARRMYLNTKKVTFRNGMVESKFDSRPVGLGAQFYLMQGLLGRYVSDDDYRVYLTYAGGSRFFSNRQQPNMLEYHSTIEGSTPQYHDDYSFVDAAEVGLVIPALRELSRQPKPYLSRPIAASGDPFFKIQNTGRVITVNNKKNILGSYGNYSRMIIY